MSSSKHRRRRSPATPALDPVSPGEHFDPTVPATSINPSGPVPDITEEDLDDSVFFRRRESRRASPRHAHKDQQLCAQVAALVGVALAELDDPVLASLTVASVAPAPDASRVLVTVLDPDGHPVDEVVARLFRLRGHLRAEVAVGVTRKRVPDLAFAVAAMEDEP